MVSKKKKRCAGKGSAWEREVCRKLSKWASGNDEDSFFWRSTTSGARATIRAAAGKRTSGQHGDITAIDPRGLSLTKLITMEVKAGYSGSSIADLLDKLDHIEPPRLAMFEKWYSQTVSSMKNAMTFSWMIIAKRNNKHGMVYFPKKLLTTFQEYGIFKEGLPSPNATIECRIRHDGATRFVKIVCMLFEDWMKHVRFYDIKGISKDYRKGTLK